MKNKHHLKVELKRQTPNLTTTNHYYGITQLHLLTTFQKSSNSELWGNQVKSSSSSPLQNYSTIETDYLGYISSKKRAKAKEKNKDQTQMFSSITDLYPSLNGDTLEGYTLPCKNCIQTKIDLLKGSLIGDLFLYV